MVHTLLLASLLTLIGANGVFAKDKIVGGDETDITYFPYQVSLELQAFHIAWLPQCGGSIINSRFILSAAHCVINSPEASLYRVRTGTSQKQHGGDLYYVDTLWYHPMYDGGSKDYDVAVLKLAKEIVFSEKVKPISIIAEGQEPKVGERLVVSGWGLEDYDDYGSPSTLRSVTVVQTNRILCDLAYSGGITQRMICSASPGKDACSGDSGGPLVNHRNELVGIVSYGYNCAAPGIPGVYTNVANKEIHAFVTEKLSL